MTLRASLPIASLLASVCSFAVACGGSTTGGPDPDPVVTPQPQPTGTPEPPVPPKPPASTCNTKVVDPSCPSTTPAPTASAAVSAFVKGDAIPLACGDADDATWDVSPLIHLYGDNRMYMTGEVHGSNEIGIVSAVTFEALAQKGLVDTLGYELPMDFETSMQRYVDTGKDETASRVFQALAPNMFGTILTKTARELKEKGVAIKVAAVDIPYTTAIPVRRIQDVAQKLTTQKDTVLATLPTSTGGQPTQADIQKANQYFDLIMKEKTKICAELSADDCDALVAMTHALWATTNMDTMGGADEGVWFQRREEVIYYNLHDKMRSPTSRMYLHMGAFHTNKYAMTDRGYASGGARMAHEFPGTKGKVFSVAPAFGDGSVIHYGGDMDLPGDPRDVVAALTDAPEHPMFVSITRPNASCVKNPLAAQFDEVSGGTRGETYDGYIHYGKLTSEAKPLATRLSKDSGAKDAKADMISEEAMKIRIFRARIVEREHRALKRFAKLGR